MRIKLLLTGKTTESYIREGMAVYIGRITRYLPFELVEIPELRQSQAMSETQFRQREGEQILRHIKAGDHLVLLDERGTMFSSLEWARNLEHKSAHLSKDLVFATGGAYGFSEEVYGRCNEKLSLSKMTFPHQLARLVFLEQLYRAMTIIKGEPYHHE